MHCSKSSLCQSRIEASLISSRCHPVAGCSQHVSADVVHGKTFMEADCCLPECLQAAQVAAMEWEAGVKAVLCLQRQIQSAAGRGQSGRCMTAPVLHKGTRPMVRTLVRLYGLLKALEVWQQAARSMPRQGPYQDSQSHSRRLLRQWSGSTGQTGSRWVPCWWSDT